MSQRAADLLVESLEAYGADRALCLAGEGAALVCLDTAVEPISAFATLSELRA